MSTTASTAPTTMTASLLDRVGGPAAVELAVDGFYVRVLADPTLAPLFVGLDMTTQRRHLRAFLVTALGGPTVYRGRDLASAHAHLGITSAQFDSVAGHLVATLEHLQVPGDVVDAIVGTVAGLRDQVVTA